MKLQISELLSEYLSFNKIISEYNSTYQSIQNHFSEKEASDNRELLQQLVEIEQSHQNQKRIMYQRAQNHLNQLKNVLESVCQQEEHVAERRFQKYRREHHGSRTTQDSENHSKRDIEHKAEQAVSEILKLKKSWLPQSFVELFGFFNPKFRNKTYQLIVDNREQLKAMISLAERDLQTATNLVLSDISASTSNKLAQLVNIKDANEQQRINEKKAFLNRLHSLLLDGLESAITNQTSYRNADIISKSYVDCYLHGQYDDVKDYIVLGFLVQNCSVNDDGVLDHYLSHIFQNGIYSNNNLMIPISLSKKFVKPICINYFSEYNNSIYSLFENYALQLLNIYNDVGISLYLVDCTNMGAKYSAFTALTENDSNKRINIIRTNAELLELLNTLSDYIIETNSTYLKNNYSNVHEYNATANIKREIKAVFFSNMSELSNNEMITKIEAIARNGNRSGVIPFISISSDELQVSGTVPQARVNAVNSVYSLCDHICMGSDGRLSLGNGTFQFLPPTGVEQNVTQTIIQRAIFNETRSTKLPLQEHMLNENEYFSKTCYNEIVIPIGMDPQGNEVSLTLDYKTAYALVGGDPGSGKSSLMHTIILQAVTRYSHDNLILYLADLKEGVEFDVYAKAGIKSVKAILNDTVETETMSSFLSFVYSLVAERTKIFEELSARTNKLVRNIEQFYEVNNSTHIYPNMPRVLVIIDEFQTLYKKSKDTGDITNMMVRMGRTYGIYLILASQRVQDTQSPSNSFSSDIKEYFIYRMLFKSPYSSAKQIMQEICSDTNKLNSAVREAQTLKGGQAIINSELGAISTANRSVQCYYPSSQYIKDTAERIAQLQGKESVIVLNSESQVYFNEEIFFSKQDFFLGESTGLHCDICNAGSDRFFDDTFVGLLAGENNCVICSGSDKKVKSCSFWVFLCKLIRLHKNKLMVNVLISPSCVKNIDSLSSCSDSLFHVTSNVQDFINYSNNSSEDDYVYNVIYNPYDFDELKKGPFASKQSNSVTSVQEIFSSINKFNLVITDDIALIKSNCSYIDESFSVRIISIGNAASMKAAVSNAVWEKIPDSQFNTIRHELIKAYYYNKTTDKFGRMKMFRIEDLINHCDFKLLKAQSESVSLNKNNNNGFTGLVGN